MSKNKKSNKPDTPTLTAAALVAELDIDPEQLKERWPALTPETAIDETMESRIRYWAADLQVSSERQQLRKLLELRLLESDRQNAALDEIDRLLAVAHASDGQDLPADPKEAALIAAIWQSEKKCRGRMAGHLANLAADIYIDATGKVIRPAVAPWQTAMRQSASPVLPENSETPPALASADS